MTDPFSEVRWWRLRSLPRPPEKADPGRWMARSITPMLIAAHADLVAAGAGASLMIAWLHGAGPAPYDFLIGGRPYLPGIGEPAGDGDTGLLYPPGAVARQLDPSVSRQQFAQFPHWVRCLGAVTTRPGTSAAPEQNPVSDGSHEQGFEDYVAHLRGHFAWVVVAEPQDADVLDEEATALAVDLTMLRKRENSESSRLELERGQTRYRELTRARRTGLWKLHVLAAGDTAAQARKAAALLCGAGQLEEASWSLQPSRTIIDLNSAWLKEEQGPDGSCSPFLATTETAARLVRGPARELPGIRMVTPPDFDLTLECRAFSGHCF